MSFNIFAEQHGKNARDVHFAAISSFMRPELLDNKITCSKEIVDNILKHQRITNSYNENINQKRIENNKPLIPMIDVRAYTFKIQSTRIHHFRKITNLKHYYNFFNNSKLQFKSYIFSDNRTSVMVEYNDFSKFISTNNALENEKKIQPINYEPKLVNLRNKITNIKILSRILSNKIDKQQINSNVLNKISIFQNQIYCKEYCNNCNKLCKYTLEEIDPSNTLLL